jgi:hypothetical protein
MQKSGVRDLGDLGVLGGFIPDFGCAVWIDTRLIPA